MKIKLKLPFLLFLSFCLYVSILKSGAEELLCRQVVEDAVKRGTFIMVSTSEASPTKIKRDSIGKYLVCSSDQRFLTYLIKEDSFPSSEGGKMKVLSFFCGKNGELKKGKTEHYVYI